MFTLDGWRVRATDSLNLVVEEEVEVENQETGEKRKDWRIRGYYGSADVAMAALAKRLVHNDLYEGAHEAADLANRLDEIFREIRSYCRKHEGKKLVHETPLNVSVEGLKRKVKEEKRQSNKTAPAPKGTKEKKGESNGKPKTSKPELAKKEKEKAKTKKRKLVRRKR